MLHGRLGTAPKRKDHTPLTAVADREGFVVVNPDGIDRSWHDRREVGPAAEPRVDDVAFISTSSIRSEELWRLFSRQAR